MPRLIDTTYTGPDATYRDDPAFQLRRALADRELALAMCRSAGQSREARDNRRTGKFSLPVIDSRVARYAARVVA